MKWRRPVSVGLTVLVLVFVAFEFYVLVQPHWAGLWRQDRTIYQDRALQWLTGTPWYYPEQVAGPYELLQGHILYPPTALLWLVPGALLPDLVWFVLPIVVVTAVIARHRPVYWSWPILALCLVHPETLRMLVAGTPTTWIAMFTAIGTVKRPAFALVFLKPSVFPVAFLGARSRGWWVAVALLCAVSLVMLPMWVDYAQALVNGRGKLATVFYSVKDLPLVLLPVVAWLATSNEQSRPGRRTSAAEHEPAWERGEASSGVADSA
jgi:hypothetical protein